MPDNYDLTKLGAHTFEDLVNTLATHVLGAGHTGFGPGADAGRDGYFEGEAPYPSDTDQWSGKWYIQSKFHKPHLTKDAQKWLIEQITSELAQFENVATGRIWPDNWIIATNIDPSGGAMTGAFDKAREFVGKANPKLIGHFHIWGGSKIVDLLTKYPNVAERYGHFLTPGHILRSLSDGLRDASSDISTIIHYLVVKQFAYQQYSKLEQAGFNTDTRPGIHTLFIDIPFQCIETQLEGFVMDHLVRTAACSHRIDTSLPDTPDWRRWSQDPLRARVWFVKGGPGQGKSTIGQYFCQIQRAALILQDNTPPVAKQDNKHPVAKQVIELAKQVKNATTASSEFASNAGYYPVTPRIPIQIELKDFAHWFGMKKDNEARGILTYLAEKIKAVIEETVHIGTLKRALGMHSWVVIFDGLDEVPSDVKDDVAVEV